MSGTAMALPAGNASPSLARGLLFGLAAIVVVLLFTVSGGVLWELGINYEGITGATATKIHPATYLALFTLVFLAVAVRNPVSLLRTLFLHNRGTLTLFAATMLMGAYIILDGRRGIATVFDTYLLAVVVSVIIANLTGRDLKRLETLLHILLAANALFGIFEHLIDYRFFPYRFDGIPLWDTRSTAFLGHPLGNAIVTGAYVMILLAGGGRVIPRLLRLPVIALQIGALVAFGGRTALGTVIVVATLWMFTHAIGFFAGRRVKLSGAAAIAFLIPALFAIVAIVVSAGYLDGIADRIANDDGSALTRLEMFRLFNYLSWEDIILGANSEILDSLRRMHGLEWGIENPVVRLVLYQGLVLTGLMTIGFVMFMREIGRRIVTGTAMPFIFFIVVINSFESVANKSVMLAQFVVLMLVMFERRSDAGSQIVQRQAAPARRRIGGTRSTFAGAAR